jgi:hypothetical protein
VQLNRIAGKSKITGGAWVQVSRLGAPLVNELVIPRSRKDVFNNSEPKDDAQFLEHVTNPEIPGILNALFGLSVPTGTRDDLVAVFLTGLAGVNLKGAPCEYLRLNTATATTAPASRNRLGLLSGQADGYPNGRRLEDDVVDITLRAAAGVLTPGFDISPNNELGDTVCTNDKAFGATFPYVAAPHDGVNRQH